MTGDAPVRPAGMPALNCARTDDHTAHEWDGKPQPGGIVPRLWCDPADPLADRALSNRVRREELKAAVAEAVQQLTAAVEEVEWARNHDGGKVDHSLVDGLTEAANRVLGHILRKEL